MKSKKIFKSLIIIFTLLISGIGFMGFSSPQKAEAKDWLHTYKSGYFTNYVINTYHPKFTKTTKKYTLRAVTFKSNSKGKGTYKIYVQKQVNGKGAWKTIKTANAKKNGTTYFETPSLKKGDSYRFKLVNQGSKKRVNYSAKWIVFAS
ncbi:MULTISPECIES: hypothetical protein [Bacillus]|uniref:hypothetical protein n=1 Tax=Bacillus TaxID=1386 RepID=UPI000778F8F5|nr:MULTISPECIES: hypothetical protein [Bacillus]APH34304.1 hypothetical protein BHE96_01305 [Bacillus subtilis]KYC87359.1 hypothetical protein B4140_0489 [Bacillus amyloliquefaciens]MBW7975191.1 hypothetical protein [Bacillus velezensis]MCM3108017.1 hypothetical protein [Bacillus velezensis]MCP1461752.1 hypothetical protein [Bacillus amyloliquefaciens]